MYSLAHGAHLDAFLSLKYLRTNNDHTKNQLYQIILTLDLTTLDFNGRLTISFFLLYLTPTFVGNLP